MMGISTAQAAQPHMLKASPKRVTASAGVEESFGHLFLALQVLVPTRVDRGLLASLSYELISCFNDYYLMCAAMARAI